MACYCANFYGAVNCQNKVSRFGDRCQLCTSMNEGTYLADDVPFQRPPKYRINMMNNFHHHNRIMISNRHKYWVSDNENRNKSWDSAVCTRTVTDGSDDIKVFRPRGSNDAGW
ncbi:hypothetical protein GGR58DRAFT_479607 [Xylaria digitata]|nr:hypothetical protein GGR58DRAFT_479607 [Xylaria digitata]